MLNKAESIRETKELWAEIEASGLSKDDFTLTKAGARWEAKGYNHDCPLCEYSGPGMNRCFRCPLLEQYNLGCYGLGFLDDFISSPRWFKAVINLREDT